MEANFKCNKCNAVIKTERGLYTHLYRKHGLRQPYPVGTFCMSKKDVTITTSVKPAKVKRPYIKQSDGITTKELAQIEKALPVIRKLVRQYKKVSPVLDILRKGVK